MEKFTRALRALSDETRLRILNVLSSQECCVCECMQALQISQTRASRNLSILYNAGFLKMRTDGLYTLYSLRKPNQNSYLANLLTAICDAIKTNKQACEDLQRLKSSTRSVSLCRRLKNNSTL
ncbi:MAG: metalloregulator ArsR/SmtB family transcription factor [Dehalococcoidia bacterium]|nr:metalloregulator ArsR/SmtB family transcription factor [Dehalococcoidia bacterium]